AVPDRDLPHRRRPVRGELGEHLGPAAELGRGGAGWPPASRPPWLARHRDPRSHAAPAPATVALAAMSPGGLDRWAVRGRVSAWRPVVVGAGRQRQHAGPQQPYDLTCDTVRGLGGWRLADVRVFGIGWPGLRTNPGCRVGRCRMSGR